MSRCILYFVITAYPLTLENPSIKVHHQQNAYLLKPSSVTCILLKPKPAYTLRHSFHEALWGGSSILCLFFLFKYLQQKKGSDVKCCLQNWDWELLDLQLVFNWGFWYEWWNYWATALSHLASRMYDFWIFLLFPWPFLSLPELKSWRLLSLHLSPCSSSLNVMTENIIHVLMAPRVIISSQTFLLTPTLMCLSRACRVSPFYV